MFVKFFSLIQPHPLLARGAFALSARLNPRNGAQVLFTGNLPTAKSAIVKGDRSIATELPVLIVDVGPISSRRRRRRLDIGLAILSVYCYV